MTDCRTFWKSEWGLEEVPLPGVNDSPREGIPGESSVDACDEGILVIVVCWDVSIPESAAEGGVSSGSSFVSQYKSSSESCKTKK